MPKATQTPLISGGYAIIGYEAPLAHGAITSAVARCWKCGLIGKKGVEGFEPSFAMDRSGLEPEASSRSPYSSD